MFIKKRNILNFYHIVTRNFIFQICLYRCNKDIFHLEIKNMRFHESDNYMLLISKSSRLFKCPNKKYLSC
jgi:hypothetical protein